MEILKLPDEILECIFLQLPWKDLREATTVCTRFNDLFSNSKRLMEKFVVEWKTIEARDDDALTSTRKYLEIKFYGVKGATHKLLQFVENHRDTLTSMRFLECEFGIFELHRLISIVAPNLKTLIMIDVDIAKVDLLLDMPKIEMPSLKDLELVHNHGNAFGCLFSFLFTKILKTFKYDEHYTDAEEDKTFKEFMEAQTELKKLSLTNNGVTTLLEDAENLKNLKFQCNEINLCINQGSSNREIGNKSDNVFEFVETQRNFLKTLSLQCCVLNVENVTILLTLSLQELTLDTCEFVWGRQLETVNHSIRTIHIINQEYSDEQDELAICDILKSSRNATSVKFSNVILTFDLSLVMVYDMPKLKDLTIVDTEISSPIHFPTVENLTIDTYDEIDDLVKLIRLNRQLKSLKVPGHFEFDEEFVQALSELSTTRVEYT